MALKCNSAIVPVSKLEDDFYDWFERHKEKVCEAGQNPFDLIFVGDSITHLFAGHPGFSDRGDAVWNEYYGGRNALNLGFGWDRTQNVLWRLDHGEFDGQDPRLMVLNIGTNNLTGTENAAGNSPEEVVEGIKEICGFVQRNAECCHIILMGVFPRGISHDPIRKMIEELNLRLKEFAAGQPYITFMDIGNCFLDENNEIPADLMPDRCHPSEAGYRIWAEQIEPVVSRYFPD